MVLVVDFGSQYTELLVRSIRTSKVFAEVISCNNPNLIKEASEYSAIVLSGSHHTAKDELHENIFKQLMELKKPMLCVCYGMQVMHKITGGEIDYGNCSEFGNTKIRIYKDHPIVDGIPVIFETWMSHNDSVIELGKGFVSVARTDVCHSVTVDDERKIYTVQFHPEVEHSRFGLRLIKNFLFLVCGLKENWSIGDVVTKKIEYIKNKVKNEYVYLAISGGLDSSVVAQLLSKSKSKAKLIFVDTGLLEDSKFRPTINYFKTEFQNDLIVVRAKDIFLEKLKGITDPEEKRKIIGNLFLEIFKEEIKKHGNGKFLAQGTIHSDLIESGQKNQSQTIKTHHNTVSSLKETFELVEPLADLFKDEVKNLGVQLGLPSFITNIKPFPGPGYSIRIIGEVTENKIEILKKVDRILVSKLIEKNIYQAASQCFSVIMNSRTVGVIGDRRSYGYVVAIRAVNSKNMMTATPTLIPIEILTELSNEIVNKVPEITRVVYDLTSKPPATIEWE
ncbi:GMP synthase [glutamine-hydrolyzing] [Candidatus Mycoplasma haematohominis]|uniref:GMP synthase (glutamine-hydrolyzing) n=1 Tax=Candidatus Mycoplasma haematohominis TaxID=1494318 RepID=A0A478FQP2_9MOLU|nr:GMP synthase [glutamine-hydrolyzing] [Candidatus Mycoplasma haemohominis]